MNTKVLKDRELSDAELDVVSGGQTPAPWTDPPASPFMKALAGDVLNIMACTQASQANGGGACTYL
jgi:hypothetical protein